MAVCATENLSFRRSSQEKSDEPKGSKRSPEVLSNPTRSSVACPLCPMPR